MGGWMFKKKIWKEILQPALKGTVRWAQKVPWRWDGVCDTFVCPGLCGLDPVHVWEAGTGCSVQQWLQVLLGIYLGLLCPPRPLAEGEGLGGGEDLKIPDELAQGVVSPESEKLPHSHTVIFLGKPFPPAQGGSRRAGCSPRASAGQGWRWGSSTPIRGCCLGKVGCVWVLSAFFLNLGGHRGAMWPGGCCTVRTLPWAQKGRNK